MIGAFNTNYSCYCITFSDMIYVVKATIPYLGRKLKEKKKKDEASASYIHIY